VEAVIIAIVLSVISTFIALELSGAVRGICRWLVRRAARKLPPAERERFIEENLADLDAIEGPFSRLVNALGAFGAVGAVIRENATGAPSGNGAEANTRTPEEIGSRRVDARLQGAKPEANAEIPSVSNGMRVTFKFGLKIGDFKIGDLGTGRVRARQRAGRMARSDGERR